MSEIEKEEFNIGDLIVAEASAFQTLSLVAALIEKGLIDPHRVAYFATFFADGIDRFQKTPAEVKEGLRQQLSHFVTLIEDMSNPNLNSGCA